jgi:tetratricopeptide (TPR) repeat protein
MDRMQRMMDQGRSFSSHERNCCFLNLGNEQFATVSAVSGFDFPDDGRAVAIVDWDQDGYPDLWVSNRNAPRLRFLHNDQPHTNHFLALQLQGNGATTNRDAIGARVEIVAAGLNGKRLIKTLHAGEGFLAQSSKWLTFGLGKLEKIEKVKVRWPAGKEEEFTGLALDQRYQLVQGTGQARNVPALTRQLVLKPAVQEPIPYSGIKVPLTSYLPMPRQAGYADFSGKIHPFPYGKGRPMLLVLWASWCQPCHQELAELAAREKELKAAGIDVVALAVDGLGEDSSSPAAAQALCQRQKYPFAVGKASEELTQLLTGYHHTLVVLTRPLPVPTSFLINGNGRLTTIYKGRVAVDDVLADTQRTGKSVRERWEQAACLPGTMLNEESFYTYFQNAEVSAYYSLAQSFDQAGQLENALEHYRAAVELRPDSGELQEKLAVVLDRLGREEEALEHYRAALKQLPDRAELHYYLGNIHVRHKRFGDARLAYQNAVRLNPKLAEAQQNLRKVEALLKNGK